MPFFENNLGQTDGPTQDTQSRPETGKLVPFRNERNEMIAAIPE